MSDAVSERAMTTGACLRMAATVRFAMARCNLARTHGRNATGGYRMTRAARPHLKHHAGLRGDVARTASLKIIPVTNGIAWTARGARFVTGQPSVIGGVPHLASRNRLAAIAPHTNVQDRR